jgi:hypothetical protein
MALFPLLARQCHSKIIICDGTEDPTEACDNLILSLNFARSKLRCSFLTASGTTDIEEEIKEFSESQNVACLRFNVMYHQESGDIGDLRYSEIIYLKPRVGFAKQFHFEENLHGCFCECCHSPIFSFTKLCCGEFPQVRVIFQRIKSVAYYHQSVYDTNSI